MINETMRQKIEPKMTALFDEVRTSYGAKRCGYPFLPIVEDSFCEGPRVLVCGKGGGSWGLQHARIDGIGPDTTLDDVPERNWYPEVLRVHRAFVENGAKRYLSGEKEGYSRGAWLRSLYMVMVHALLGREIGERWDRSLRNPEDAEYFYANVAITNLDKVARKKNNLDSDLRKIHDKYYTVAEEIEVLEPRLVWFPTGPSYDQHLRKALPGIRFETVGSGIEEVKGMGCLALRTYHPQYTRVFKAGSFARYLRMPAQVFVHAGAARQRSAGYDPPAGGSAPGGEGIPAKRGVRAVSQAAPGGRAQAGPADATRRAPGPLLRAGKDTFPAPDGRHRRQSHARGDEGRPHARSQPPSVDHLYTSLYISTLCLWFATCSLLCCPARSLGFRPRF